jgi:hypothetical protein
MKRTKAYRVGYRDGYDMACVSMSSDPGCDGWDGTAINAVGHARFASHIGSRCTIGPVFNKACRDYCEGAQAGANRAVLKNCRR